MLVVESDILHLHYLKQSEIKEKYMRLILIILSVQTSGKTAVYENSIEKHKGLIEGIL